jgi:hypothetical protein
MPLKRFRNRPEELKYNTHPVVSIRIAAKEITAAEVSNRAVI